MNYHRIIEKIESSEKLNFEDSFSLAKDCSILLSSKSEEAFGRKILIYVLENWYKIDEATKDIWIDLIESAGFYPYLDRITSDESEINTSLVIRKYVHQSENLQGKYLHEEQKFVLSLLNSSQNVIVSAPTSFGKSLLIEELVASKKYKNIVIVQPTLALLDETRIKLKNYIEDYKLIIRTSQLPSNTKGNCFLLTAERVMEYSNLPRIDLLVLDEFYKLSTKRDDERSDTLNNAFNLLVNKHRAKFYLLGPNIDSISEGFEMKYNAVFYKTDYSLVENKIIDCYSGNEEKFGLRGKKAILKEKALFELLLDLIEEQTIIYCSSPARVRKLSQNFNQFLLEKMINLQNNKVDLPLVEWAENYVSKDWSLIKCLKSGIGIHDGALQKHITSTIIKYFNEDKLKYLFCTSTIIEGVNTSAKNVIFFDSTKGMQKGIDYFDYCNIKGRSGRLMVHYTGKIFNFNPVPKKELIKVDIPFFEQDPISDEVLIHIEREEVKDPSSKQYRELINIPQEERELFKKNGVSVKGQQQILKILERDIHNHNKNKIIWDKYPEYHQLQYVLNLAWENLLKDGETTRPMTQNKLVKVTFDYGINRSIEYLVHSNYLYNKTQKKYKNADDSKVRDDAILDAFQILKHWFQYKVPKWLNVINNLQRYVAEKNNLVSGDYSIYAYQIENDFVQSNLSILSEYGIPRSAIDKLASKIPINIEEDEVLNYITKNKLIEKTSLLKYEEDRLKENL
ncbi:DEAD/DEAH box helicase [Oceanobacillus picturae]|uniref:DEAD/DEAH box helicase n=1 Tax=Oceanobacillus picturae TaxID=171693 RepID=UPI0036344F8D